MHVDNCVKIGKRRDEAQTRFSNNLREEWSRCWRSQGHPHSKSEDRPQQKGLFVAEDVTRGI